MHSFLVGFATGIGIIVSLAGWGALVSGVLRIRFGTGFGFNAAVGLAFSTSVGGFLNLAHVVLPGVVRAYLLIGVLLAAFAGARQARRLGDALASARVYFKQQKLLLVVAFLFASVTLVKYATAVSPGLFHPQDDYHAYFVFPSQMLQTGTLGQDPFSERRIVSSLGGNYFVDSFLLSVTGQVKYLRLMDEGVSFIILLVLLSEIMIRRKVPGHWMLTTLLAASLLQAEVSNITCVYGGVVLLLLLFEIFDRTVTTPELNQAALLAIILAGLMSLKTTFAPMAGIFFLSFFLFQLFRSPDKGKTIRRAIFCALLILTLLLPWMIDSHRSSNTFFYPLLGKGYHGSKYGIYLLPTAHMGIKNVLGFLDGLANPLGAMLAIAAYQVIVAYRRRKGDRLIELIILINLALDLVFIGIGIGGVQTFRYTFALLFSVALFLLVQQLAISENPSGSNSSLRSADTFAAFLLLGILLGAGWVEFTAYEKFIGLDLLQFSLRGRDIDSASEIASYRDMQSAIPPGQKVMVRLDKNYLLDFRRNIIYVNDLPGGASLPPGIPIFKGPDALADYLVQHGIRYLAYSYGDEASFSRELFSDRLKPKVNVWLRRGAEIAFDFQDNLLLLGKSRKKLYDDGSKFVLDLAAPVQSTTAISAVEQPHDLAVTPKFMTVAFSEPTPTGPVVNVNPGMSTQALQSALSRAPRGATILFAAGTYNITSQITVPCRNLHLTGPVAAATTAILAAGYRNSVILAFNGGCGNLGSIRYLHFENTGAVYFGVGDNSNFTFEHNLVTNLPSGLNNVTAESGLFFDGALSTTLKNVLIQYNTFGDDRSCVAVFATPKDEGGYCAGVITSQGEDQNLSIEYNNFIHVEQGIHFNQLARFSPGKPNSVCVSCTVDYNYILNYHRIGIEIQVSAPTDPILIEHNAVIDPINSSWGTFAVSLACCLTDRFMTTTGHSPSLIFDDNVLVASIPVPGGCPPYGVEFWGIGARGTNSLIEGTFCNGYTWGFGAAPWAIKGNYICGPNYKTLGGYISNQQKKDNPPEQSDNVVSPTCSARPSQAPQISPAGGSISGSQLVTLSDPGSNTGIWYTTDGSTPVPGSGTAKYYTAPFTITDTTTVKAVGMWGAANQPVSYPPGYGYVPSSVVTASFAATSGAGRSKTASTLLRGRVRSRTPYRETGSASSNRTLLSEVSRASSNSDSTVGRALARTTT